MPDDISKRLADALRSCRNMLQSSSNDAEGRRLLAGRATQILNELSTQPSTFQTWWDQKFQLFCGPLSIRPSPKETAEAAWNAALSAQPKAEPVAWTIPGDDTADANGFIPARITQEGEFSKALYAAPVPQPPAAFDEARECTEANAHFEVWASNRPDGEFASPREAYHEGFLAARRQSGQGGG